MSLPSRTRLRMRMLAKMRVSMLPPHSTMPTVLPLNCSRCCNSAATPVAPAPSVTVFSISISRAIASSIVDSSTSNTSFTNARAIVIGISPVSRTAKPSAIVSVPTFTASPRNRCDIAGNVLDSTPMISMLGFTPRAATAQPAIRPPPPTGIMSVSSCGAASSISSASVPCPAMMYGSSYGCTNTN